MKTVLIYPPTCDPTAPYLAVPMLTGFLRAHGVEVVPIDANLEAWDELLEPGPLAALRDRVEERLATLERRASLDHAEQLEYAALWKARGDAHAVPRGIARAKATLRDREQFFDPARYASAVATIDAALRAVSAAHHPLHLDFTAYRTPFALTTLDEVAHDASPGRDPFDAYVTNTLAPRIAAEKPGLIGLSVCFPGQLQPAYAFALKLKRLFPDVHLTVGGPAITQPLIRLEGQRLARALGPFDSAVVFEGENTLLSLVRALDEKRPLRELTNVVLRDPLRGARYVPAHGMEDLKALPAPDFTGLPLDRYFSPELTLPYDPTRGCYWGKCTFCHYGLAEVGTAKYRERDVDHIVEHLRALSEQYGTRRFYFSQDSVAPKTLVKLAEKIVEQGLEIRWGTDLKPEKYLTAERAETLAKAGAVACALGVESAAPRVLKMIDKGAPIEVVSDVIDRLAGVGIAPEAMCFTDFPTESYDEAMATLEFLDERRDDVACFIVGTFGLTHGALVAQDPGKFGLEETWQLEGDELGLGLFFSERKVPKTDEERALVDEALTRLSAGWALRTYPWAGAVSTAHTLLYYDHFGPGALREIARSARDARVHGRAAREAVAKFDLRRADEAMAREAEVWGEIVHGRRRVSRADYAELVGEAPRLGPAKAPRTWSYVAGDAPRPGKPRTDGKVPGRRPSHAPNSARRS